MEGNIHNPQMKSVTLKSSLCSIGLVASLLLLSGCASSQKPKASLTPDEARARLEVLRSEFNTYKIQTFNQIMNLTAAEADKFWPIYRSYEKELAGVGDRKLALAREFLALHKAGTLDDQNCDSKNGNERGNEQWRHATGSL